MHKKDETTALPGVFSTLAAGFDLTAKHLWLLFLPVILDVFYWLGPRLRFQTLIEQAVRLLPQDAAVTGLAQQLTAVAPATNLFTTLTVQVIGVPALMVGVTPGETPLQPPVTEVSSWPSWLGLFLFFTLVGLLLTALYYTLVGAVVQGTLQKSPQQVVAWSKRVSVTWVRLVGLVLVFLLMVLAIYAPLIIVGALLLMVNTTLGSLVLLLGPFLAIWVILLLSLTPAGIAVHERPLGRAVLESVRLVQANLPSLLLMLLTVLLLGTMLDWLLLMAESGSWLTLINILAHAFVSTALVAAIFLYYRDRYRRLFGSTSAVAAAEAAPERLR